MINRQEIDRVWFILIGWIFANMLGWATGLATGLLLVFVTNELGGVNSDQSLIFIVLPSVGVAAGFTQWWVIRDYFPDAQRWIPVTVVGYLLALLVYTALDFASIVTSGVTTHVIRLILMGAVTAIPQWWLLRQYYPYTSLWIVANAAGFLGFIWLMGNQFSQIGLVLIATFLSAWTGLVTGIVLAWLVDQVDVNIYE